MTRTHRTQRLAMRAALAVLAIGGALLPTSAFAAPTAHTGTATAIARHSGRHCLGYGLGFSHDASNWVPCIPYPRPYPHPHPNPCDPGPCFPDPKPLPRPDPIGPQCDCIGIWPDRDDSA